MEMLRLIIEGGWVVEDAGEWVRILGFLEVERDLEENHQAAEFFKNVA